MDEFLADILELLESGEQVDEELLDLVGQLLETTEEPPPESYPLGSDLLWILAGGNPQAFTQYLRNIPDPAMNQLARNPGQLNRVIQQLQHQVTLPAGESEQGVPRADLQSSNIYGFQYDPRTKMLRVRFNSGSIYEYGGIPPQIFKAFKVGAVPAKTTGQNQWGAWWTGKVPSLGATFYELIRQREFPYRKVA